MKEIKNVAIIGAGAMGSAFAGMFYNYDKCCVSIIADATRYDRLKKDGFIINNRHYFFNVIHVDELGYKPDLIIVAVKYHHLEKTIKDLKNFISDKTIMLSIMNGIDSEEIIQASYPELKILYSMVVGIDAVRIENKTTFASTGRLFFGEKNNFEYSEAVLKVKDFLEKASISYVIPENMIQKLWWKFMINVGINQASAVLQADYEVFQTIPEAKTLMEEAMREVISISVNKGINLNENDLIEWYGILKKLSPQGKTSMLQDVEAGRKTEVEMFALIVCRLGKELNIQTPVNEMFLKIMKIYEKRFVN